MGQESLLMWPYFSQFVTHLTDFEHLEELLDAFLLMGSKCKNSRNIFL